MDETPELRFVPEERFELRFDETPLELAETFELTFVPELTAELFELTFVPEETFDELVVLETLELNIELLLELLVELELSTTGVVSGELLLPWLLSVPLAPSSAIPAVFFTI